MIVEDVEKAALNHEVVILSSHAFGIMFLLFSILDSHKL